MQKMKKKASNTNGKGNDNGAGEVTKLKERHIVSWSQEEDDILREQIRIHGTDNWTIIASKFKDKTTRQCRRRWYTYLNSDFKKGGWSPEEDMLLCEAQKIFGNRWTEIAKVVSGRTDNAVKNRFSTLCKKRAKHEALAKENSTSFINLNNKRVVFPSGLNIDGVSETTASNKKMRVHISNLSENLNNGEKSIGEYGRINQLLRPPFAVLAQNFQNGARNLLIQQEVDNQNEASTDAAGNRIQGTFLKKDDPKILALMQQAELLSNLALKVNSENTDQSLENAWRVLHDYLSQTKETDAPKFTNLYSSSQLENIKDSLEDLRNSNEGSRPSLRQCDLQVSSPDSSEYSTGSTLQSHVEGDKTEQSQAEHCALTHQNIEAELHSALLGGQNGMNEDEIAIPCCTTTAKVCIFPVSETIQASEGVVCQNPDMEFSSPLQVTPLFRSLAASVPTPNFSESERHFLLKTLGLESTSPNPSANSAQHPTCKRVLLHSL